MGTWVRVLALAVAFVPAVGGRVAAAPQILGLVVTAKPMPLTCARGECAAEFSVFCIQRNRKSPVTGTAYRPAKGTLLTLSYTDADGTKRSLPANDQVIIRAQRGHFAVRIALPERAIRRLGGRDAAIAVGPLASLVPVAQSGDESPLDKREIAYVTGPLRAAAARVFDEKSESRVAAQTIIRLINDLPPNRVTAERRSALWRKVIGGLPQQHAGGGLGRAARDFDLCKRWADTGHGDGLRYCLEERHDDLASDLTKKAWKVSDPGS